MNVPQEAAGARASIVLNDMLLYGTWTSRTGPTCSNINLYGFRLHELPGNRYLYSVQRPRHVADPSYNCLCMHTPCDSAPEYAYKPALWGGNAIMTHTLNLHRCVCSLTRRVKKHGVEIADVCVQPSLRPAL